MAHQPNLLPLKLLVISLGFVLVGGFVFLMATIVHKVKAEQSLSHCPDATINIGGGGTLGEIVAQDKTVQITLHGNKTKVLTVDRCSGKLLQTLTIVP